MATNAQWNTFEDKINAGQWLQAFNILETIVKDIDARLKVEENKSANITAQLQDIKNRLNVLEQAVGV